MGIFNFFKPKVQKSAADAALIVPKMDREFRALREQFLFGSISGMKSEGAHLPELSPLLQDGSELDSALKGFQLASILGFARRYLGPRDWLSFEEQLYSVMAHNDAVQTHSYNEKYLDCQGNIECLCVGLAQDIHRIWNNPPPANRFIGGLKNAAETLAILSQAVTAAAFDDSQTESKLKGMLRIR